MDVILLERVEKHGQMGDIITVKDGFARNYLIPQGKALRATDANRRFFETQKAEIEAQNLKRKEEAQAVADKLQGVKIVLIRPAGDSGQLYGSVASRDIAQELSNDNVRVGRTQVKLDRPIKTLGIFDVRIQLHAEVDVHITANVARSEAEAEAQFEKGGAVLGMDADEEEELDAESLIEDLVEDASIVEKLAADSEETDEAVAESESPAEETEAEAPQTDD